MRQSTWMGQVLAADERWSHAWMLWTSASPFRVAIARVWARTGFWVLFAVVLGPLGWGLIVGRGWLVGGWLFLTLWLLPVAFFVFIISGLVAFLVARLFPRMRPYRAHPAWQPLIATTWLHWSFPSKHTVFATTLLCITLAAALMGSVPWWQVWVLVVGTGALGAARVGCGVHYFGDIVGGVFVGAFVGFFLAILGWGLTGF